MECNCNNNTEIFSQDNTQEVLSCGDSSGIGSELVTRWLANSSEIHWICLSQGVIYDANYKNTIMKSMKSLV